MKPYLPFLLVFWTLFSFPKENYDKLRAKCIALAAPSWQILSGNKEREENSLRVLQMENATLQYQVKRLCQLLLFEAQVSQTKQLQTSDPYWEQRLPYLIEVIEKQMQGLPGRVIFREASLWNSSLWLNIGEKDNRALGREIVAKNSPVLLGNVLVGVVEQVEKQRCRVRLITDAALAPSVCILRGDEQNRILMKQIEELIVQLEMRNELSIAAPLITGLQQMQKQLQTKCPTRCLARGTLQGASYSKWRTRTPMLKGSGFHYPVALEKQEVEETKLGLVQVGDLLVTSGIDGIFPSDLPIATVSAVFPIREGRCTYEIEALSLAGNFDELTELFVLPPN